MINKTAIVTGASSGLGQCIAYELSQRQMNVIDWSLVTGVDVRAKASIEDAVEQIGDLSIDILVNCAGINGINFLPDVTEEEFDSIMATNAKAIFLTTQALLPNLKGGTILNVVSNAAHMPMTSSLAYCSSKAAAWQMARQLARELKKTHDITCFSVSPNKLSGTGMSAYIDETVCKLRGWTMEEARAYQIQSLPAGVETNINTIAEFIGFLLSTKERHRYLNGCDIQYGA